MRRWHWHFGGLFWRLSMSYLLVTFIAALTIECTITLAPVLQDIQNSNTIRPERLFPILWSYWQPNGFYFIFLASSLGTGAGMLIARHLTGRLRRIAQATKAWSRGEFQDTIHDHIHDELGQLSADLNHMAEQLQLLLLARRKLAILEERARLKQDLHDAVKQHLFAVQMQLSAVRVLFQQDADASYRHLVEAEKLALLAQQELATLIEELRPPALMDKTLGPALEELCHDWSQRTAIALSVHIEPVISLPAGIEQTIFRVTQEALSNIARHSHAHNVYLKLLLDESHTITFSITDDGHGFNPSITRKQKHSLGLHNMRERIAAIDGLFTLESSTKGTSIQARIPVPVEVEKK
ncbi:sensor histidine kinase LiaS [Dictyobacter vulcani]|uniref:Sensor histidine kinase LiaS n=1 Tax=Dictyobacter vulcani TaxID=2607529 RepID=A0A5J4KSU0_9CHLR|nr:histidine kinase [Dictyobacter vulcani]GER90743.1 sensor histidine kinase LiaS [Dictyobacter vulcani]